MKNQKYIDLISRAEEILGVDSPMLKDLRDELNTRELFEQEAKNRPLTQGELSVLLDGLHSARSQCDFLLSRMEVNENKSGMEVTLERINRALKLPVLQ